MYLNVIENNQNSSRAWEYFKGIFTQKGYTVTAKDIKVEEFSILRTRNAAAAETWYMMKNSAVIPAQATPSPLYFGDFHIKQFVQAFTSGSFDRQVDLVHLGAGPVVTPFPIFRKAALVAVETGLPTDANFTESVQKQVLFNEIAAIYGAGAAPVGTIRTIVHFCGFRISLV